MAPRASSSLRSLAQLLFVLLAFWAATLYLGGDLGKWSDDYAYDRRSVVDDRPEGGLFSLMPSYFYRPLYYILVPPLLTTLGGHPRLLHLITVAVHAAVVLACYAFFRRFATRKTALAGAALFAVYPAAWEVPFWPSAIPTGLACGVLISLALFAQSSLSRPIRIWRLVLAASLGFAIPCFNEQPAACIPAIAFLALGCTPNRSIRRELARGCLFTAAALAGTAAYLVLYLTSIPADHRGAIGGFTPLNDLGSKLRLTADLVRYNLLLEDFGRGALLQGILQLRDTLPLAIPVLVALVLSGLSFLANERRTDREQNQQIPPRRFAGTALFAATAFALSWAPILVIQVQGIEPRLCYTPVFAAACLLTAASAWSNSRRSGGLLPPVLTTAFLILVIGSVIAMVGIQSAMRSRWLRDGEQATRLRTLIPDPLPSSIVIPILLRDRTTSTGEDRFDRYLFGPLERPWSAPSYIRRVFRRPGFAAGWYSQRSTWHPVAGAAPEGLLYDDARFPSWEQLPGNFNRDASGRKLIPWDRVVPIVIDEQGQLFLVGRIETTGRAPQTISVPQTQSRSGAVAVHFEPTDEGMQPRVK